MVYGINLEKKIFKQNLRWTRLGLVKDHTLIFDLEPLHSILLGDPVLDSNTTLAPATTTHPITWAFQNNVEVHPIDSSRWIILDTQVNMLLNTKTKAASITEVPPQQFVFLHLQSTLQ
uniref:Uncharacterized protein n=1 Tax=Rhizophora mucronata TaxID=61149 RepID=A0A2P2KAN8_RHIMU